MQDQPEMKFLDLRQEDLSVAEYEVKFSELSRFVPEYVNTEAKKAKRFQKGLSPWIRSQVALLEIKNYTALETHNALQSTTDAGTRMLLQAHLNSLHMHQIQGFQHNQDVTSIKTEIDQVKKDIFERLDAKLSEATMLDIKIQLRKNSDLATKVDSLDKRMTTMEVSLTTIHRHQAQQTQLLQAEPSSKGEKVINVQISQVIVPEIILPKPPVLDNIDLIHIAAAKLESKSISKMLDVAAVEKELDDKWRKIDAENQQKFGPIQKSDKIFTHHSQVKNISMNEISMNYLEKGQTSCIKSPKANLIMKPKRNCSKFSDKNHMDIVYETPRPDVEKLLARSIAFFKEPADSALKRRIAKIYRNGKEICVVAGYPQFVEAKKEEKEIIRQEKKQAALDAKKLKKKKEQDAILDKLQAVKTTKEISVQPYVIDEPQDQKVQDAP
ncbi:hypothetical protein AgCh_021171 [Apium graveolens]